MQPIKKLTDTLIERAKEECKEMADTNIQEIDLSKMVAHFKWKMKINSNINN